MTNCLTSKRPYLKNDPAPSPSHRATGVSPSANTPASIGLEVHRPSALSRITSSLRSFMRHRLPVTLMAVPWPEVWQPPTRPSSGSRWSCPPLRGTPGSRSPCPGARGEEWPRPRPPGWTVRRCRRCRSLFESTSRTRTWTSPRSPTSHRRRRPDWQTQLLRLQPGLE